MEHKTYSHSTDEPSPDTLFSLLSNHCRRTVIRHLSEHNPPIDLQNLARLIVSQETSTGSEEVVEEPPDKIAVTLHHIHLPRLADTGLVNYNTETNTVTSAETEVLTFFLENTDGGG